MAFAEHCRALTTLLEIDVSLDVCGSREAAKEIEDALAGPVFPQNYTVSEPISEFFLSSAVAVATTRLLPTLTAPHSGTHLHAGLAT